MTTDGAAEPAAAQGPDDIHDMPQAYRDRHTLSSSSSRNGADARHGSGRSNASAASAQVKIEGGDDKGINKSGEDGAKENEDDDVKVKVEDLDLDKPDDDDDSSDSGIEFLGISIMGDHDVYILSDTPSPPRYPDPDEATPVPEQPRWDLPRAALRRPSPEPSHFDDPDFLPARNQNEDSDADDEGDGDGDEEEEDDDGRGRWMWSHPPTDEEGPAQIRRLRPGLRPGLARARDRNRRVITQESESEGEDLGQALRRAVEHRMHQRTRQYRASSEPSDGSNDSDNDDDSYGRGNRRGGEPIRRRTPSPSPHRRRRRGSDDDDEARHAPRRRPSDDADDNGGGAGGGAGDGPGGRESDSDDEPRRRGGGGGGGPGRGGRGSYDDDPHGIRIGLPRVFHITPRAEVPGAGGAGPGSVIMSRTARSKLICNVDGRALDARWHLRRLYPRLSDAHLLRSLEMVEGDMRLVIAETEHLMRTLPTQYFAAGLYRPHALDLDTCRRLLKRLFGMYGEMKFHPLGHLQALYPQLTSWAAVAHHIGLPPEMGSERVGYVARSFRIHLPKLVGEARSLQSAMGEV